jgi:hypothetical protein
MDWWNDSDSGKLKYFEEKTGSSATSLITNLTCTGLGSKSIFCSQRPAANNPSHGTAFMCVHVRVCVGGWVGGWWETRGEGAEERA